MEIMEVLLFWFECRCLLHTAHHFVSLSLESPHLGVDISTYSAYKTEAEVIMPCGLVSDVQTVITSADGLTIVQLKVDVDATAKMIDFELETTLPLAAAAAEPRSVNMSMPDGDPCIVLLHWHFA